MADKGILPDGWTLDEIRERADDVTAELLDPDTRVLLDAPHPNQGSVMVVDLMIGFGGDLCLARSVDHGNRFGEWFMGHRGEPIRCWAGYGTDLGAAIDGL